MKSAVCYELGKPLVIDEITIDAPERHEVKVRLVATGICHSDISLLKGEWGRAPCPLVAGHEGGGIVEEVGEDVTHVKPGDHVIVSLLRSCKQCVYCATGRPYLCRGFPAAYTRRHLRTTGGAVVTQGLNTAAFAEQAIVDQSQVVRIPDSMPLASAALLACGVVTGVGAVMNTAQVRPGESVVVIGTGGVGLSALQGAALAGACRIVALDIVDMKLEAARRFGATDVFNSTRDDLQSAVLGLTDGLGADYVLVTVGSTAAAAAGLTLVRPGGALVIVGLPRADAQLAFSPLLAALNGRRILTSFMGSTNLSVDVPRLVDLYQQGRLKLDELITKRYAPEQINEAIEAVERGEALRNVVMWEANGN
jgi:S-(hydroxymethyl)mycothiol dehydrogenase